MESLMNPKLLIIFAFSLHVLAGPTTAVETQAFHTGGSGTEKDDFLRVHNEVRAMMHKSEFTWDPQLEEYASSYGAERAEDCALQHSGGPFGENIFEGGGNVWTARDAVAEWLKEVGNYDLDHNTCQNGKMCGHYTQIIWKTSHKLGCACIICKNGDTFAICEYDPPGNYVDEAPLKAIDHEHEVGF